VGDGRVAPALQQLPGVGLDVVVARRHRRGLLVEHQAQQVGGARGLVHELADGVEAAEEAQVGDRHVRPVQEPQLRGLPGPDVADELGPGRLPHRARAVEPLDHPLPERLGGDGRLVGEAQEGRRLLPVGAAAAGTIRSTMQDGNCTVPAIHAASRSSDSAA
jgi:hypothetical protein